MPRAASASSVPSGGDCQVRNIGLRVRLPCARRTCRPPPGRGGRSRPPGTARHRRRAHRPRTAKAAGTLARCLATVIMPGVKSIGLATEENGVTSERNSRLRRLAQDRHREARVARTGRCRRRRCRRRTTRPARADPREAGPRDSEATCRHTSSSSSLECTRITANSRQIASNVRSPPARRPVCASAARPLASRHAALEHDDRLCARARGGERVDERVRDRTGLRRRPRSRACRRRRPARE